MSKRDASALERCETCEHYHAVGSTCAECGHVRGRDGKGANASARNDVDDDEKTSASEGLVIESASKEGRERARAGGASTTMVEIIDRFLVCGAFEHTCSERSLVMLGVRTVMNAVPTCSPCCSGRHLAVMTLGTEGSRVGGDIDYHQCCGRLAALHVKSMKTDEAHPQRVLVYCMSGRSRAPAVAVAYMMFSKKLKLSDAIAYVVDRYPPGHQGVRFKPEDLQALQRFERELAERSRP